MRRIRMRTALVPVFSAALAVAAVVVVRQAARLSDLERRHTADLREEAQLRSALLKRDQNTAPPPTAPADRAGQGLRHESERPSGSGEGAQEVLIRQLKQELEESRADSARAQDQLKAAEQQHQNALARASEESEKGKQELQARLDALQEQLDSARAQAQASHERVAALEADNARARDDSAAGAARVAELRKAIAGLQDLDRRRDTYMSSVLRRYRDITEQLRSMTTALDASRGSEPSGFNGIALSRVQNAILAAEDDLRRLNEVNAQAHQIENKLAKN